MLNPVFLLLAQDTAPTTQTTILGTVYQSILDGGWMMVPIGLCSIIALTFFLERWMALSNGKLMPSRFRRELEEHLGRSPDKALALCESSECSAARVFQAGLRRRHASLADRERGMEDAAAREIQHLSGNLRPLVVVSTISPLLGLLGTVIGMIRAFQVIAVEKAIGKPELLADGISMALITTAAGLIVAIPAQVAFYYLKARIDRFGRNVETVYHESMEPALASPAEAA